MVADCFGFRRSSALRLTSSCAALAVASIEAFACARVLPSCRCVSTYAASSFANSRSSSSGVPTKLNGVERATF